MVCLDVKPDSRTDQLEKYLTSRGLHGRVKTYFGTSQADAPRLREIVATDFNGPLDLVFDDASHFYRFSKVSFETLFPLLRPGGLYVIEDWSWVCWSELPEDFNPSMTALPADITPQEIPLPRLVCELAMATGKLEGFLAWAEDGHYTLNTWIASMHVFADFIVLERGKADPAVMGELKLQDFLPRTTIRPAG